MRRLQQTRSGRAAGAFAAAGLVLGSLSAGAAHAAGTARTLDLKVLLVGEGATDPVTQAWQATLGSEGVPYTLVQAAGALGGQTVTLPALSSGAAGDYNGVVLAGSPNDFAAGQLAALDSYESAFGVRQVDGYMFPSPALGLTETTGGAQDGTTATLTGAGLAALPALKGPVPFDAGSYGYTAAADAGAPVTPWLENSSGGVMAALYQHPATDAQANVGELSLLFNYNQYQTQWLLLAPGLVDWVTQGAHLGLYRNYFGEDVDDVMIADNEWSRQYQCTPAATDPVDVTCPAADQGNPAAAPPDTQMTAADVAYVANWEKQTGITLEMAFNAIGACTAPSTATESSADCSGSYTAGPDTFTDPGRVVDPGYPDDAAYVNALIADQGAFNWVTHTWSHAFLGCLDWDTPAVTSATAGSGGSIAPGAYTYEVTAVTAYGESEPSNPQDVTVGADGSVTLAWPDATNGGGPTLSALEGGFGGGSGFWGYDVYREAQGSNALGLVGRVAEDPTGASASYSFTDTGAAAPGGAPSTNSTYPTATDPGIECAGAGGADWLPADSTTPDSSIDQEIGLDVAFAQANGLANFSPATIVTGEYSGLENPNMPRALSDMGISVFAADASRQPNVYTLTAGGHTATSAPRYPSNIYYNAANWPDEINEYGTLYDASGVPVGDPQYPGETGHCADTASTTCLSTPATESGILASESHIMLGHILSNNPRVGYAHQSNLIGPATQTAGGVTSDYGYTLLSLIDSMLTQYEAWYTTAAPIDQMTDATESNVLSEQSNWATALNAGTVSASETNGVVTVSNTGSTAVAAPITVPTGTTANSAPFGQPYGGANSAWTGLAAGASTTLVAPGSPATAPAVTSAATADFTLGAAGSFTVTGTGSPTPALSEAGPLPAGLTFTDDGNGTATISGTPAAGTTGAHAITVSAANPLSTATQTLTIAVNQAPAITSASSASGAELVPFSFTVTTTGYPAAAITESGPLPRGLKSTDNGNGTSTISGTPGLLVLGTFKITLTAANSLGTATQTLSLTIKL